MTLAALPLYTYSFFLIMSVMALFPVLPEIRTELGLSYSTISIFVAALGGVRLFLAYPSGFVVDRLDKRKVLLCAGGLAVVGLVLIGSAHGAVQLIAGRAFVAAASILSNLTVLVLLAALAGPTRRGAMLSMNNAAQNAGGIFAPVLAGVLARAYSWRASMFGVAVLVAFGTVLVGLTFPKEASRAAGDIPARSAEGDDPAPGRRWQLALDLGPLFALSLFVFLYRSSFRHTILPLFSKDVLHMAVDTTGYYLGALGVVSMLSILCFGFVADRYGRKAVLVPSLIFTAASAPALLLAPAWDPFAMACALTGLGGAINSMPIVLISDRVAPRSLGRALGTNRVFADFGYFTGSISVGFLLDRFGFRVPILAVGGCAVGALALAWVAVHEPRR